MMASIKNAPPDRVAGTLVGLAAGDALGAGYEFGPPAPAEPRMIGGGLGGWDPGEWTDDTQMAICIAEVTATGFTDPSAIGDRFLDWYRGRPADVGVQTRAVLGAASSGGELHAVAAAHFERHPKGAAGNGSLMRTAPVALAHLGDDEAMAQSAMEISSLTHGDPLAAEACVLWCIAIDRAIRDGRLDGVRDGLDLIPVRSRDRWATHIGEAETQPASSFTPNGFVVRAFQAAYASIVQTPVPDDVACLHLQHALSTAVRVGDDTDTVAAIAGALLGARWGASAVPAEWRLMLHGWPDFRARDLVRLALATENGGPLDDDAWPVWPSMFGYYRGTFSGVCDAVSPLADDNGVLVGDVGALSGAGGQADVVVSLCRVGWNDVREEAEHFEVWLIDGPSSSDNPNLDFVLTDTVSAIVNARSKGKTVFLHCVATESRTPTVAAGYLAQHLGISGLDALDRVAATLPGGNPNRTFRKALERLWP